MKKNVLNFKKWKFAPSTMIGSPPILVKCIRKNMFTFLLMVGLFVLPNVSHAQLLTWNTFGNTGSETTEPSTSNDPNIASGVDLTKGTLTTATNGNRFGGSGWFNTGNTVAGNTLAEAVAGNDYIQFIVTPNSGFSFTPTNLSFIWEFSGTGTRSVTLRSSADGFTTDLGSVTGMATSSTAIKVLTISGLSAVTTATTFRLYGYGYTATTTTGGFDCTTPGTANNVILNGTTAATSTPVFSFSPTSITALSSTNPTAGTALTTTISGANFTTATGDITVTAPANFEVSNDGSTWGSSATFAYTSNGTTFTQPTVSFRIAAGVVAGAVSGSATSAGGGVSSPPSIALSGTVISSDPTVVASGTPTKLFGNFGFASDTKSITVSGTALGVNNLTCTLAGYEFSTSATGPFTASPFDIAPTAGTVATTTVYFRLPAANAVGDYNGNLEVSSSGATTVNIAVTGTVYAAGSGSPFTKDNILVLVQGDGVAARTNAATPSFLNEYTPAGAAVQSVALPFSVNGTNRRLSMSGTATADGAMTLSPDGKLLVLCGYDSPIGTGSVANTTIANANTALATNARVVATVNQSATINSSTFVSNVSGANIRSAITLDGSRFWLTNSNGARTIDNATPTGVSTSMNTINSRILALNGSTLTVSSASGSNIGINTLGNLPTGAAAPVLISGLNSANGLTDAYSFFYFDRDPAVTGNDLLYVANNAAGIKKFSFDGTTWSPRGTILTSGVGNECTSITGNVNSSGDIDLIVTVGTGGSGTNSIKRITDTTAYNAQISNDGVNISTIGTTLATSATNTVFRAVSFAPVDNPDPTINLTVAAPAQTTTPQNNTSTVLLETKVEPSLGNAILSGVSFVTNGTYVAGDIANFKLYLSTDATFDSGDTLLATDSIIGAAGETINFSGLASSITKDTTRYLLVVATVATCGTISNTFGIGFTNDTNFTFIAGNKNISPLIGITGDTNTISDSGQVNVTAPTTTSTVTRTIAISWVAPAGCYDDVMIVVATASNTGIPSGNGSLYTANINYNLGTILGNGRVVYKGNTSPQTVIGLLNGTTYFFKIFTRKGSLWSAGIETTGTPALTPTLTEVLIPQFIQGVNGTNANRVPYVYRVKLSNLLPSATYRYNNSVVLTTDLATDAGTGGMLFPSAGGFTRSTSQSLNTAGSYGSFTTDSSGAYTGWFITEPNATVRFTPGTNLKMRIMLNDGAGGSSISFTLTTTSTATVINLGTSGSNTGTAISGTSYATDKNFVMLWDNTSGAGRPLSGTFVENDGTTGSSYAPFYTSTVEGVTGAWGTIIPNALPNGVRRIQQFGLSDGSGTVGYAAIDTDGIWPSGVNTVSPASGLAALVVSLQDAPLSFVTQIRPSQCGQTMNYITDAIQASPVTGATEYTFEVTRTDNSVVNTVVSPVYYFYPATLITDGLVYGKSYSIRVQAKINGDYKIFGPTCIVSAPAEPASGTLTKIRPLQCGKTMNFITDAIQASPVYGATRYEFNVSNGVTTVVIPSTTSWFRLSQFPGGGVLNTAYTIEVRSAGPLPAAFTSYGDACVVSTPIARMSEVSTNDVFEVKSFPNPFASHFNLDIESSSDALVQVKVYDMIGRQLEVRKASVSELSVLEVGRNYPSGIYNVIVSQGEKVKSIRMIKR